MSAGLAPPGMYSSFLVHISAGMRMNIHESAVKMLLLIIRER